MTGTDADRLVDDYLTRLERALDPLPASRAEELVGEIGEHIVAARAELPGGGTEAELLTLLDRLGEPEEIARDAVEQDPAAARPALAPVPAATQRGGWVEGLAVVLLPFGGLLIPVLGWLAGVALLWSSDHWTVRDKLIGTLVPPGGYGFLLLGGILIVDGDEDDGSAPLIVDVLFVAALVVLLLMPIATMVYLLRRRRALPVALAA